MSDSDTARRYNSTGYITRHAQIRFHDHYGHDLSKAEWKDVISDISNKRGVMLSNNSEGMQIWAVRLGDKIVRFIYDPTSGHIVTTQAPEVKRLKGDGRKNDGKFDFNKRGRDREKHR